MWNFKFVSSPVPNHWTWAKAIPQKTRFFWSNPSKIEVMITSLIQMLELPNFTLRRPGVAIFADIIKILTMFIIKIYIKTQEKLKCIEITCRNAIYICISWYSKIYWFWVKKCWFQHNSRGLSRDSYIFWIFFG